MAEHAGDGDRIDSEGFVRELFAAMRAAGLEGPYIYDPKTGIFGDDERGKLDVRHLYLSIGGHAKWQRDAALKKVAEYYVERPDIPVDWDYARPRIVLTIVTRIAEEEHILQHAEKPKPFHLARITPHVAFGIGYPVSVGTLNVTLENIERWGVEPEAALQAAAINLEKRSKHPWVFADDYPGVYGSPWQDGFDACRMFFPRSFTSVPLRGRPVVVLPTPKRMMFAGSEDEQGLVNLARLARTYVEKREGTLYLRPMRTGDDGESWEDWLPRRGHPARAGLRWLQAVQERMDYMKHAALLRLAAKGQPLTVSLPDLEVVERAYGTDVFTKTVWDDAGPCGLPKADRIEFRQEGRVLGIVRWAVFFEKFPLLLDEAPGYPPRFVARHFPESWQLPMIGLDPPGESE